MSKPLPPEENALTTSKPGIKMQVENTTVDGGIQALMGNNNIQFQGDSNVVTFNKTEILQISVEEIKTREFIKTSPYKSLNKFEPADKDLFFGRDQFLTGLVNELEQTNLIVLLGASGSGKSSVVRAGLIPWLSQKRGSRLVNLTFTPDIDPFESFYASLLNKYKQTEAQIAREAKADTLTQVVERLKQPDDYWFILIDQFEELFTTSLADKREHFIKSLVKLSKTKQSSVKIMGTMRADFLDRLSPYPQLVKATDKHRPFIAEMQPDELRLAIEQPAAHHGVVFDTGLVEEIIKNIQGQAGYLPLLQYTLNLLWEDEVKTGSINDRTLNLSTYRRLGGVRGALQQRINDIYETLPEVEKLATRKIFLKLVDIGEDSEIGSAWKPVRRRALRSEFSDQLEQTMLAKLINENLLVSDRQPQSQESTVEIAHEILLTCWTTLNTWIEENRHAIALHNRLNDDVANWQAKKADDELWSGSKLEKVVELRKDGTFNQVLGRLSDVANQFIDASVGLRDRQRRRTIIGLTGFSVVAFILAGAAGLGWWFTEFQRQQTITGLTTASQELFDSNKEFDALLTSINAGKQVKQAAFGVNLDMRTRVKEVLQDAVFWVKEQNRLEGHLAGVNSVSFSADGRVLATGSSDGFIKLWDVPTGKEIKTLNRHTPGVNSLSFSSKGLLASKNADGTIKLWDIATDKEIKTLMGDSVNFSPDGRVLASKNADGTIKLWDVTNGMEIRTLPNENDGFIDSVSFSPNGKLLAVAGENQIIKLWNIASGEKVVLAGHTNRISSVSFSPNGEILASASWDNTIKLWDVATSQEIKTLTGHKSQVNSISFSPDGKLLASASNDRTIKLWDIVPRKEIIPLNSYRVGDGISFSPDGKLLASTVHAVYINQTDTIKLWDVATHREIATLTGHKHWLRSVSFSSDGKLLASAAWDGTIRLWDVRACIKATTCEASETLESKSGPYLSSVSFSPDGRLLASGNFDWNNPQKNSIQLWDVDTSKLIKILQGHTNLVNSISFSPDGKRLASASDDQTIKLWDVTPGQEPKEIKTLKGHTDKVKEVSFSLDGKRLASASDDQTIKLWDVTPGQEPREIKTLKGHIAPVIGVSFSPDGRRLVSGSEDKTIKLWDVAIGKEITTLRGHRNAIRNIGLSYDGQLLASQNKEELILWNVKTLSNLTLEDLMVEGCDWVRGYLKNNPNISDNDKQLCNGIGKAK